MQTRDICVTALALAVLIMTSACATQPTESPQESRYTFSWQFVDGGEMAPRGGTTKGPAVTLDTSVNPAWQALHEPGISEQERDRRAILAMAGGYRTSFDFIETVGFVDDYEAKPPYQSWGTEYVYVVTNEPDFVSLQHIIVMFFETPDGEIAGPAVVKHWRQDWQYEDLDIHAYVGHSTWERRQKDNEAVRGTWSQSVYQVDDSPRYQAIGRWEHDGNYSSWTSENTWRPLPRREYSVRDDYHVLSGTNRHTITPTGWVHEEDNLKLVLNADGTPREADPYLAREAGLNRYDRIVEHDFSAGDGYWEATGGFWADVRAAWDETFELHETIVLKSKYDDRRMFETMFAYAGEIEESGNYDQRDGQVFIDETLSRYLELEGL